MMLHLELASVRSGQDWAHWLAKAHAAPPLKTTGRPAGQPLAGAWAALAQLAQREGFAAARGDCAAGEAFTSWRDRRIHVRHDLTPERAVIALAHQLGHILLHAEIAYLDHSGTVVCQGIRKAEADSVAYLAATYLGIDAPDRFPRVSSWAGTSPRDHPDATVRAVASRVLGAAAQITAHLQAALAEAGRGTWPDRAAGTGEPEPTTQGHVLADVAEAAAACTLSRPGDELARAHQAATRFFGCRLAGSWVPGYLESRGFGPAVQRRWQAGYAPAGWTTVVQHLRALGYRDSVIEAAGLGRLSWRGALIDTFRDRAMLPIRNRDGTVVAFIGRAPASVAADVPKYLNSPSTDLYRKSAVLFGLWEARGPLAQGARPVIVEGPFDAIAITAGCGGQYAGVAPCGTALTAQQAATLAHAAGLRASGVLVAFDADRAGQRAAVNAYRLLTPFTDTVIAAVLPPGQDPAQILAGHGPAALTRMLAAHTRPLADLVTDAEVNGWSRWLRYAEGQINALRAAAPLIAAMPPAHVARQVARLAGRLGLDYATVTEAVTEALTDAPAPSYRQRRAAARDTAAVAATAAQAEAAADRTRGSWQRTSRPRPAPPAG